MSTSHLRELPSTSRPAQKPRHRGIGERFWNSILDHPKGAITADFGVLALSLTLASGPGESSRDAKSLSSTSIITGQLLGIEPVVLPAECTSTERALALYIHGAATPVVCAPGAAFVEATKATTLQSSNP